MQHNYSRIVIENSGGHTVVFSSNEIIFFPSQNVNPEKFSFRPFSDKRTW